MMGAPPGLHLPNGTPPSMDDATEAALKQAVAGLRAGANLTPKTWPNGARVAVCFSFDVDNEFPSVTIGNSKGPAAVSNGEYGATTGLPRILALLDRHQLPASFFIPAMSAALHPEMIREILKRKRHEIGVHGWTHEYLPGLKDAAQEERLLRQSIDYLAKATGKRPMGFRAPGWEFSPHTLDLLRKAGFLYDTSLSAMDQPYEIVSNGKATGLIELPVSWILDDVPYGETDGSLEGVFKIYRDEFDVAYEEKTLFVLTLHPQLSGRRSRVVELENLVAHMKSKPGVWFATLEQIANFVKSNANGP